MLNLLLAEDQPIVRQGLKMMLEQDDRIRVIAEAANGLEAIQAMEHHLIDLVVMDIRMPEMNGIDATRKIKQRWPNVKILILTTFNDEEYALQTLKEGASAFLLKTGEPEHLIQAVHSCMNGGMTLNEHVAAKVLPRLLDNKNQTELPAPSSLSPREQAITKLVGEGKTNREIAEELHLSIGTVKNHMTNILHKLELRDRTQLAIYAVKSFLV